MKYKIYLLMLAALLTIGIAGCGIRTQNTNTAKQETETEVAESGTPNTEKSDATTSETNETENEDTVKSIQQDADKDMAEKTDIAKEDAKSSVKIQKSETTKSATKTAEPKETKPIESSEPAIVQTPSAMPVESPKAEEAQKETTEKEPTATAADCKIVADRVVSYINSYRSSLATKLTGLTTYAEYRSRQLIGNFAHDTADERAAATALQYGEYVDTALYGMTGNPYYTANAREAIAKIGYAGTINEVAERLAKLVKNSQGHWAYVGSSDYPYIAVGVSYESGMWYCDIAMTKENTDNK